MRLLDWSIWTDYGIPGPADGLSQSSVIVPPEMAPGTYHVDIYIDWKHAGGHDFAVP